MSIKLDLSKFKHVSSDADTTTLKHMKDGHTITLAHKSLDKPNQEALKALAVLSKSAQTKDQTAEAKAESPHGKVTVKSDDEQPMGKVIMKARGGGITNSERQALGMQSMQQAVTGDEAPRNYMPIEEPRLAPPSQKPYNPMADTSGAPLPSHYDNDMSKPYVPPGFAKGGDVRHYAEGTPEGVIPPALQPKQPPPILDPNVQQMPTDVNATYRPPLPAIDPLTGTAEKKYNAMVAPGLPEGTPADVIKQIYPELAGKVMEGGKFPEQGNDRLLETADKAAKREMQENNIAQDAQLQMNAKKNELRGKYGGVQLPVEYAATQPAPDTSGIDPMLSAAGISQTPNAGEPKGAMPSGSPGLGDTQGMLAEGLAKERQGIQQGAKVQAQLGNEQMKQYEQTMAAQQTARDFLTHGYQSLETERNHLVQDVKDGHIDPNQFWTGNPATGEGSHSKLMAGLGMILAGFNPTSNPNAAVNFLKYQIDNNIKAQEKNLDTKNNLLSANLKQFGNMRDAADMTRLQLLDDIKNRTAMTAAKYQGPMAAAQAQQMLGALDREYYPLSLQLGMRNSMMQMNGSGAAQSPEVVSHALNMMSMMNPKMADDYRSRYVKGVGFADNAVPDSERKYFASYHDVKDLIDRSLQMSHASVGQKLSPDMRSRAASVHAQLIGAVKNAQQDGVFKPSEADFILSQIGPSADSMLAKWRTTPKLQEVAQTLNKQYADRLGAFGLKPPQGITGGGEASQQNGPQEGATATNHATGQTLTYRNGKWTK